MLRVLCILVILYQRTLQRTLFVCIRLYLLPGQGFSAVKRKKVRHFRSFRVLKFESVQMFYEHEVRMKTMRNTFRQTEFRADKTCA